MLHFFDLVLVVHTPETLETICVVISSGRVGQETQDQGLLSAVCASNAVLNYCIVEEGLMELSGRDTLSFSGHPAHDRQPKLNDCHQAWEKARPFTEPD